jgi:hypothetical protein
MSPPPGPQRAPLGLVKWMTDSPWKMLTSSMPGMVLTPRRFSVLCSRLSSVVAVLCTAFFFLCDTANQAALSVYSCIPPPSRAFAQHRSPPVAHPRTADITHLRTVPFPPVLTAEAILANLSRSMAPLLSARPLQTRLGSLGASLAETVSMNPLGKDSSTRTAR